MTTYRIDRCRVAVDSSHGMTRNQMVVGKFLQDDTKPIQEVVDDGPDSHPQGVSTSVPRGFSLPYCVKYKKMGY